MDASKVIEVMGGRKRVMEITGLSKGRLSQWTKENWIPTSWMTAFRAMKPEAFSDEGANTTGAPEPGRRATDQAAA